MVNWEEAFASKKQKKQAFSHPAPETTPVAEPQPAEGHPFERRRDPRQEYRERTEPRRETPQVNVTVQTGAQVDPSQPPLQASPAPQASTSMPGAQGAHPQGTPVYAAPGNGATAGGAAVQDQPSAGAIPPQAEGAAPAATPRRDQQTRSQLKSRRKRSTENYPAKLGQLHNFLDDIWVNILLEAKDSLKTLLVSGATRNEGSMYISFHLALFLALGHNMKTLYVDLDVNSMRKNPYIPDRNTGLASFFIDDRPLSSVIAGTEYENFFVLSSGGGSVSNRRHNVIIEQQDLRELVDYCEDNFDIAVFSGQPITFRPVMLEVARAVDHTVLVCRYGQSRREVSKLAIDRLRENDISLLGMILNGREYPVPRWVYRFIK